MQELERFTPDPRRDKTRGLVTAHIHTRIACTVGARGAALGEGGYRSIGRG